MSGVCNRCWFLLELELIFKGSEQLLIEAILRILTPMWQQLKIRPLQGIAAARACCIYVKGG